MNLKNIGDGILKVNLHGLEMVVFEIDSTIFNIKLLQKNNPDDWFLSSEYEELSSRLQVLYASYVELTLEFVRDDLLDNISDKFKTLDFQFSNLN